MDKETWSGICKCTAIILAGIVIACWAFATDSQPESTETTTAVVESTAKKTRITVKCDDFLTGVKAKNVWRCRVDGKQVAAAYLGRAGRKRKEYMLVSRTSYNENYRTRTRWKIKNSSGSIHKAYQKAIKHIKKQYAVES